MADQDRAADDEIMGVGLTTTGRMSGTDYAKALRARLRAAREERGLSRKETARAIEVLVQARRREAGTYDEQKPYTIKEAGLAHYENFIRHPPVDVMAAWASVVGLRLIVDLDAADSKRVPVLLSPRAAPLARILDLATEEQLQAIGVVLAGMLGGRRD